MAEPLAAVPLPGVQPDSLGRYLAALGLLRLAARKWPRVRGAWRDGFYWFVGGPATLDDLVGFLWEVGEGDGWTPYERAWKQARDDEDEGKRKRGDPSPLSLQQSNAAESVAILSAAHCVATEISPAAKHKSAWRFDNPLFGYGGSIGQRDFAAGWGQARDQILLRELKDRVADEGKKLEKRIAKKKVALEEKRNKRNQTAKGEAKLVADIETIKKQIETESSSKKKATLTGRLQKKNVALEEKKHKRNQPTKGEEKLAAEVANAEQQRKDLDQSLRARAEDLREDLKGFLKGAACRCLGSWNAASWFSEANKISNCGQSWFGGGQVTPWAMLLACEGIPFFSGSPSRRLGSRARAQGAFPFVTRPAAPERQSEAGRDRAEVWLPLWSRPMTVSEVRLLFLRGRAEVGGAGATTPAAFAAAVVRRGVDAGIDGFQRFVLGRTTTDQVFESRLEGFVPLPGSAAAEVDLARAGAIESVLALCDRLPRDRKKGKRWQFHGLRGPMEAALVRFAASPDDPELAVGLVDAVVATLDKVDRNRKHRKVGVRWRLLPLQWLPALFGAHLLPCEARLAMGLASLGRWDSAMLVHRFGMRCADRCKEFFFPESSPHRCTWESRPLATNLALVLRRRLLDADSTGDLPLRPAVRTALGDVEAWLSGQVEDREVERWFSRLVLFDWQTVPDAISDLALGERPCSSSAMLALHALLRPLFEASRLWLDGGTELLRAETGARTIPAARQLASLLAAQDVPGAVRVARSRYHMACQPLARINAPLSAAAPDRLLASLMMPTAPGELVRLTRAWLRPACAKGVPL